MLQDGGVFPQWNRQLLEDTTLLQMTLKVYGYSTLETILLNLFFMQEKHPY